MNKHAVLDYKRIEQNKVVIADENALPTTLASEVFISPNYLFNAFYDLLIDNYQQHHEIAWYSEKLCLTPKYFSGVIRQITGKSAAQWINEVLVLHAKRLLYTRRDMNVQQIAYELGFKGNANFCRFFKDQTGLRPSEYRKQQ